MRLRRRTDAEAQGLDAHGPPPEGFPFGLSDDRLQAVLRDMIEAIPGFDNYSRLLPELKLALILIGSQG